MTETNIGNTNEKVVRAAARLLEVMIEHYGEDRALSLWDGLREHVDKDLANSVLLGRLTGQLSFNKITIIKSGYEKIGLIKQIRSILVCSLKDAKDYSEGTKPMTAERYGIDKMAQLRDMLETFGDEWGIVYE